MKPKGTAIRCKYKLVMNPTTNAVTSSRDDVAVLRDAMKKLCGATPERARAVRSIYVDGPSA